MTVGTEAGPALLRLRSFPDADGLLTVGEFVGDLPFVPQRFFVVSRVPPAASRACHAQRTGAQLLMASSGRLVVDCWTGTVERSYGLDDPGTALHVPPGNWIVCRDFSPDAVMTVLASDAYDRDDQIEDFDQYLDFVGSTPVREAALTS